MTVSRVQIFALKLSSNSLFWIRKPTVLLQSRSLCLCTTLSGNLMYILYLPFNRTFGRKEISLLSCWTCFSILQKWHIYYILVRPWNEFRVTNWSEVEWVKKSEMSDFSNKNVLFLHPFVPKIALITRVDFSQPKYNGRLKSTLLTFKIFLRNL